MSDVARLDQTIVDLVATFDTELAQIQAELSKPEPDLSAQIAKLEELRLRIAGVIPDAPPADETLEPGFEIIEDPGDDPTAE